MIQSSLRIGVVGCGHWGKNLVRNFAELGFLVAVADADAERTKDFAQQYKVIGQDFEAMLADGSIDALVIASPAECHFSHVSAALKAGKHVFVEKPLALSMEQGQVLCDMAQSLNKILMVGHLLQFHPAFLKAKAMVQEGEIGKLQYIYSNRLNLGKFRQEENSLWSFAPHDISMILGLADALPHEVYATGACHIHSHIEDITTTHMRFNHGVQAHVFVSWLHPYKEQKLVVVGDAGMLVFDDGKPWEEKLMHYSHKVTWRQGMPTPDKADGLPLALEASEPLNNECLHFAECVTTGKRPRTDGEEGLRVLQVLNTAQASLRSRAPIQVDVSVKDYFAHPTAEIDAGTKIGKGCKIWHFSHILSGVTLGENCNIGQNVVVGPDVTVGRACKIQNNVSLYKGVTLGNEVFCGPSCVFTNVKTPRASVNRQDEFVATEVADGVTIGANATIVCGVHLGPYSMIGAGAVVTQDVLPHALVVGNPAKQIGWVSHAGERLDNAMQCPKTGQEYRESQGKLVVLED